MRTLSLGVVTAVVSLLASGTAAASQQREGRWVQINQNEQIVQSIDPRSITRSGDTVQVWQRNVYAAPQDGIKTSYFLNEYDCIRRTFALVAYADEDERGRRLDSGTIAPDEREIHSIVPDSFAEGIYDQVCR